MAVELATSALALEVARITQSAGSPYFSFSCIVHAGGKDLVPLQFIRSDLTRDYRASYSDANTVVLAFGVGTAMNDIGPYQDDLRMTINISNSDTQGTQRSNDPVLSRTLVAYLADEMPSPTDSSFNPSLTDTETANRSKIIHLRFTLEEVAVQQLRKMYLGMNGRHTAPFMVMQTLLSNACAALKLSTDEALNQFELTPPNNTTPRSHVVIRDTTPVLEIPDLIQNEQGGIYSTGLGFYIQGRCLYTWPLYDMYRQDSAKRILQIVLAPTRHSTMIDKTWVNDGRMVSIYSAGINQINDDSLGALNNRGNAVRFTLASSLIDGGPTVSGNKMTANRSKTNSEFSTTVMGNGQNVAPLSKNTVTNNIYQETTKLASRAGAILSVPWRRSNPELITPGMAVEVLFDHDGIIRTIEGTLLFGVHSYELEGQGMNATRVYATTTLSVFVDRNDPDYIAYVKGGGAPSPTPEIANL